MRTKEQIQKEIEDAKSEITFYENEIRCFDLDFGYFPGAKLADARNKLKKIK